METLLTMPEVAERLRTPVGTLKYWRHIGYGPLSAKIGRRVVYRSADVEKWLDEQYGRNGHPAA